jgi:hypothetical protein
LTAPRGVVLSYAQVISDMATNEMCYKPNLLYVPSAEYRFIDMYGSNELHNKSIVWPNQVNGFDLVLSVF